MVKRIAQLTPEQIATFSEWTDRWMKVGHRTGPLTEDEWQTVEAASRRAYGFAELPQPAIFIRATSPLAGAIATFVHLEVRAELDRLRSGVDSGVRSGVSSGVGSGVCSGVDSGVDSGVYSGVYSGVRSGVDSGVSPGVYSGVSSGVSSGVDSGVSSGMILDDYQEWLHEPIRRGLARAKSEWYTNVWGGQFWCSWQAFLSWFRDVGELELDGDLWDRFQCQEDLTLANYCWWYATVNVIADRPLFLHVQPVGQGEWEMHCETGPAIGWADGWALHFWHGTSVPAWVVEAPTLDRIRGEVNTEVRRCAIESYGWDKYLTGLGVTPFSVEADPGNPGHELALYELPDSEQIYDEPVQLLVMRNASLDRDGSRRTYAETVPGTCKSAIAAAAWQFDVPLDIYRALARAT